MPADVIDAVIEQLRANTSVTAAFGDTLVPATSLGTPKFFADYASDEALPYLVIFETGETYDFMTPQGGQPTPYVCTGTMIMHIYQVGRAATRQLGLLVAAAINDMDLDSGSVFWPGLNGTNTTLKEMRMDLGKFEQTRDIGPATPTVFDRVIQFTYFYQGFL